MLNMRADPDMINLPMTRQSALNGGTADTINDRDEAVGPLLASDMQERAFKNTGQAWRAQTAEAT